jgi:glutathione S-transferase
MSSEAKPALTLYTAATPNGIKISVALEELKAAYPNAPITYDYKVLNFSISEQKEPWFLKINPNGRIPAIVHHKPDGTDFNVFESGAILLYLAKHFDPEHSISFPDDTPEDSETQQWLFFVIGGIGPMQGQANHFVRYAPEKIQYGIDRYTTEVKRLYSVIDDRLKAGDGRDYLVGPGRGKFSIADINAWAWSRGWSYSGIDSIDKFPHFKAWLERIKERPAVQLGADIPPRKK